MPAPYTVRLLDLNVVGECLDGETLLDGLITHPDFLIQSCNDGSCGACKCWLYRGNIESNKHPITKSITRDEIEAGLILPCVSNPIQDCDLLQKYQERLVIQPHVEKTLPVMDLTRLSPSITSVKLGPLDQPIEFSAGQFMRVTFPNQPSRDYSNASLPDDLFLELHIMLSPNGIASQYVHQRLDTNDLVHIKGPYGHAHYRHECQRPIVCFANGTGLAPMRSIAETTLQKSDAPPVSLLWHMDDEADFYWREHFTDLSVNNPKFNFQCLTDSDLNHLHQFCPSAPNQFRAYTAGSPIFVKKVIQSLLDHGQQEDFIHSDAFHSDIVMEKRNIPGYINS